MKKNLFILAALLLPLISYGGRPSARVHRVMTCNIRVALSQDDSTGNGWGTRRKICEQVMRKYKADVYCLQEVLEIQYKDLKKDFPDYQVLGFDGPEMDAMPRDGGYYGIGKNLIMYSMQRYELTGAGVYWLSETPLLGGSKSWGTARARHVNWARLRDRKTGEEFRVLTVHLDHISQEARLGQISVVLEESSQYPVDFPQVMAGDLNAKPSNPVAEAIRSDGWTDSYRSFHGVAADTLCSAHGFKGPQYVPKGTPGRIDYIYYKGKGVSVKDSFLVFDSVGGKYPSDHYFLVSDLVLD